MDGRGQSFSITSTHLYYCYSSRPSPAGGTISKKLGIQVLSDTSVLDLYRGIRTHLASLLSAGSGASAEGSLDPRDLNTMSLGLSHSLSRYKLKFSPDKVDTMVVQAIGLLDDLDKEINIYAMRVKVSSDKDFKKRGLKCIEDRMSWLGSLLGESKGSTSL